MPNAGKKKMKSPKKETVNAMEYARGFAVGFGDKNAAIVQAKLLEKAARSAVPSNTSTANFWANIVGHLNKA